MKVQNPIIGRSRGSAGGMTFCKNYDKNVARAKAFEVSNPKTALQTNQRTFFKEVMDITKTVSDEELRSLFGIKPKAMSRRNALSKQIAAAYSVVDGQKVVDFSKLQAIGNGKKVSTPFFDNITPDQTINLEIDPSMFGDNVTSNSRVYLVLYNSNNGIKILEDSVKVGDISFIESLIDFFTFEDLSTICGYLTIASDGSDAYRQLGSFTLKTRATNQSNAEPQPPTSIDVYANGITPNSYFHFNENAYLKNLGYYPEDMENDGTTVADSISFDNANNWWAGSLDSAVDPRVPIIINFVKSGEPRIEVKANWIVQ